RPDGSYRRPGRRWWLCRLEELHIARRPTHGVCPALKPRGCSTRCRSRSRIYPRSGANNRAAKADAVGRAGVSESVGSARNEPGQGYVRETRCCGYHAGRMAVRCRRTSCIRRWLRRSGRGQARGRKILRQGGQPDVQSAERRDGGLAHLFRIPPLSLGLPCLSRSRRRRIELRPGAQLCLEDDELSRFRQRCRERAQERQHGAGERHAVVRHQSERHVLYRGHIRLFAGARQRRRSARKTAKARRQARGGDPSGKQLPRTQELSAAEPMTNSANSEWLRLSLYVSCTAVAATFLSGKMLPQAVEGPDWSIEVVDPKVLRVCADPHNMPFSTDRGEGFENKLAELLAEKLGKGLSYSWYPQATGFVRNTLAAHKCDVIMGVPQGDDLVQVTNPYYRTAYALVFKQGHDLEGVDTLGDPRLKGKRVGIVAGTPPGNNMAANGLMANAKPYPLVIDTR